MNGRGSNVSGVHLRTRRDQHQHQHQHHGRGGHSRVRFTEEEEGAGRQQQQQREVVSWSDRLMGVLTACIAMGCLAGFMTILVMLYVTVRPFSLATYRRLSAAWGGSAFLDAISLLLPNTRIYLTGDSDVPSPVGSSVLVSNHVTEADWWAVFLFGRCVGLRGSLKAFLRNEFLQLNMENVERNNSLLVPFPIRTTSTTTSGAPTTMNGSSSSSSLNGHHTSSPSPTHATAVPTSTSSVSGRSGGGGGGGAHRKASPDLALASKLLHLLLDFPLIASSEENGRDQLHELLRSFAALDNNVHLLFYPEGWSLHNGADRRSVHEKSNEFAKREGKQPLDHLLLPRTRGFNSSLECLRESSPVVYDVTMAYSGYNGSLPHKIELSLTTLWDLLRRKFPREVHLRIKRYSMEEVTQDSNWLYKKWVEKDRLLSHFARHQQFPTDNRGYPRHRIFDTRQQSVEASIVALLRLMVMPSTVPFFLMLSFPIFWTLLVIWLCQQLIRWLFADNESRGATGQRTPGSASVVTPYVPATPFASPSIVNWRDTLNPSSKNGTGDR